MWLLELHNIVFLRIPYESFLYFTSFWTVSNVVQIFFFSPAIWILWVCFYILQLFQWGSFFHWGTTKYCLFESSIWIVPMFHSSLKCFRYSVWIFFHQFEFYGLFLYYFTALPMRFIFSHYLFVLVGIFLTIRILCLFLIAVYSSKCKFRTSINSALIVWADKWTLVVLIHLQFIIPEAWEKDWFLLGIKCQVKLISSQEKVKKRRRSKEWSNGKIHDPDYFLQFA